MNILSENVFVNDNYATQHVIKLMGNNIIYTTNGLKCTKYETKEDNKIFVRNTDTGVWSSDKEDIKAAIKVFEKELVFTKYEDSGNIKTYDYSKKIPKIMSQLEVFAPRRELHLNPDYGNDNNVIGFIAKAGPGKEKGQTLFACTVCKKFHFHGANGWGDKISHCTMKDSVYGMGNYIVVPAESYEQLEALAISIKKLPEFKKIFASLT